MGMKWLRLHAPVYDRSDSGDMSTRKRVLFVELSHRDEESNPAVSAGFGDQPAYPEPSMYCFTEFRAV
jgi:hypothetical protein